MSQPPDDVFGERARRVVVGLAIVSLVATVASLVYGRALAPPPDHVRDSYGRGSLSHLAFVETMRALGVHVDRWLRPDGASAAAPLFVIEPDGPTVRVGNESLALVTMLDERRWAGRASVVVLPKWVSTPAQPEAVLGWREAERLLDVLPTRFALAPDGPTRQWQRLDATTTSGEIVHLELRSPRRVVGGEPILFDSLGSFVARDPDNELYVIADPDLLHSFNHHRADHARFLARFVRETLHTDTIVIDEVFHGQAQTRSLGELFGRWPGVLALVHGALIAIAILAMGRRRFGPPDAPVPVRGRGPREAIAVAASVLASGSRTGTLVSRYVEELLADLQRRLRLPEANSADERAQRVDELAGRLGERVEATRFLGAARRLAETKGSRGGLELAREASALRGRLLDRRAARPRTIHAPQGDAAKESG